MEKMKIEEYNKKQEELRRRKQEKEVEMLRTLSEKIRFQQEREKKLRETKIRYETSTEGFKNELSQKLSKINERVKYNLFIIRLQRKGLKITGTPSLGSISCLRGEKTNMKMSWPTRKCKST